MAQGSAVYRGVVELADSDANRYATLELATSLHPSESRERLALRLLAWLLLYEEGMAFRGGGVSDGEAPDLAVRDADGNILHWIEVGTPTETRLQKAARRTKVTVVTHEGVLRRWQSQHKGRLPGFEGEILVLDEALVRPLAERLSRRFRWQATISGDTLYLEDGSGSLSSPLRRTAAPHRGLLRAAAGAASRPVPG